METTGRAAPTGDASTRRGLALQFVERFCAGDVEGLAPLLTEDLDFAGPLLRSRSRDAYLAALRADPPEPATSEILSVTEDGDSRVAVFYEYRKPGASLLVAQLFTFRGEAIAEIRIVFDTGDRRRPRA